ncbi:MAG TPA: GWxTD domain-containing protein [Thermoanaerobaculia bacterium]|jgi:GWxTD domain-containing protein
MHIRKPLLLIAALGLIAPALLAGGLSKYKNWPNSPQGYFMTNAERAEWKASVKTDDDAEQFIKKFVDSRGAGFADDVAKRAEMADKHLSVAGRAGSLTTRGKLVILFGPPASFNIVSRETKGSASGSADSYQNIDNGGRGGGGSTGPAVGDMAMAAQRSSLGNSLVQDYTFTYKADALPAKQSKDLVVVVEVKPGDGSDRINDRKMSAQLDDLFEAAAQARLAAAKK